MGIVGGLCGIAFAGFATMIAGVAAFGGGVGLLFTSVPSGILTMGLSLLCISIGALLGAGTVLSGLSTLLPFLSFIPAEGFAIPGLSANPAVMMILPAGGFLMMGFIFAVIQKVMAGKEDK